MDRWQQVDKLLEEALEQEPDRRTAFLDEACHGDVALRREVESLLSAHGKAEGFTEAGPVRTLRNRTGEEARDLTGRQVGHYQILSRLGEGGMGVVYKARDQHLDRFVAIKVLPPELVADRDRKRRFVQEAKSASALNHPNIITVHDIASDNGTDFMVMEYVEGKALDQLIPRRGMKLNDALKYAIQIADGLAKAHSAGIIHRDLKPGNVMVGEGGLAKILDFGLAKLVERSQVSQEESSSSSFQPQTEEGIILGTACYMSPEQADGRPVDDRSDIFSFGAVLYEMVTGRRAFQGDTSLSILTAILREEPRPAREIVPGLPPGLDRLINWCLRKNPQQRIQHVDDLKLTLEDLRTEWETPIQTNSLATSRKPRWPVAVSSVTILAGLALTAWLYWYARSAEPALSVVPLTSYPGLEVSPSFSPDGNQVAFAWNGPGQENWDIYVQLIGDVSPRRLTDDPAPDQSPAWSPDGRWIAFMRTERDRYSIRLVSPLGGAELELAQASLFVITVFSNACLSWSPDSKWLVYSERPAPQEPFSLFAVSLETRERKRLTSPPQENRSGDIYPAFSPDGRALVFSREFHSNIAQLYIQPLTATLEPAGQPRQLTFEEWRNDYPAWTPDGRQIVYSSGPKHYRRLWRMDPGSPTDHKALSFSISNLAVHPALSRQKHRLAFTQIRGDVNIWRVNAAGGSGPGEAPVPLIASTLLDHTPAFSPDGRKIAFVSYRSGASEIWVCDSNGQNLVPLTSFKGPEVDLPQWSPDGSRIVFEGFVKGQGDVFWIGANGGSPQRLTDHPGNDSTATWSRDGRWIYFCSDRSGRQEIWKMATQGGETSQITRNGGRMALESWDSQWLYVLRNSYGGLWRRRIEDGKEEQIADSVQAINFAVGSKGIYFMPGRRGQTENPIELLDPKTGKRRTLAAVHKQVMYGFAVSPDERWILYPQVDERLTGDLMLAENFR